MARKDPAQLSGAVQHNSARCCTIRRGAAQFVAVLRISRTCGGAAPPAAMPRRADRIQFYLCGLALGGGSYAGASRVNSTNRKILQNSIRESHHGALVHREQTQASRCRRRGSCCGAVPRFSAAPRERALINGYTYIVITHISTARLRSRDFKDFL